jgi:putative transposase
MLVKSRKRDAAALEQRRRATVADWQRGMRVREVARKYSVDHVSVLRWLGRYQREGARGLRATRATGRPSRLAPVWLARLPSVLLKGAAHFGYLTDLWTTERVAQVIHQLTGVRYHRAHVWRLLDQLGFSWQCPERRARERDERKTKRWLRTVWPAIKKMPAGPGIAAVSRRIRVLPDSLCGQDLGSSRGDPCPPPLLQLAKAVRDFRR